MKEDIKALDTMRDALLTNHSNIIAGKDLKQSTTVIANANALSNVVTTKYKMLKAEETNSKAIRKLAGK